MNMDDTHKAVKQAATAAFLSAGVTLLMVLLAMQHEIGGELNIFNDPLNLVDAALVVGCGVGLLRYSRSAAVILFVYFLFAKIMMSIELDRPVGIGVGLIFLYFFWKGVQGSFTYHKLHREADKNYRPAPKWSYYLGIPLGIVLLVAMGIALMVEVGMLPSVAVIDGKELPPSDSALLVSEGIVRPDEKVQLFYSTGLTSILDDGNLLTDTRIISYERIDGELAVYAAPLENVSDLRIVQDGDYFNSTIIEIWTLDGDGFRLLLSAQDDGDKRFINEVKKRIGQAPDTPLQPMQ